MKSHLLSTEHYLGTLAADLGCFPFDYEAYPPQSHCRVPPPGIRSLVEFGTLVWALSHSVLYPSNPLSDASPKAISERTSYYGV